MIMKPSTNLACAATSGRRSAVAALILAAGEARRFGFPKQLLPWHNQGTMLGTVIAAAGECRHIDHTMVVLGAHASTITVCLDAALAESRIIVNRDWRQGMFTSLCLGLREISAASDIDGIVVLLGDLPFIGPAYLDAFLEAAARDDADRFVIAREGDRPAHPYLVRRHHIGEILSMSGESGMRPFVDRHFDAALTIPVDRSTGRQDVDTWTAYHHLSGRRHR